MSDAVIKELIEQVAALRQQVARVEMRERYPADYFQRAHLIDVRDYGAVGDGQTDDRAAIQSAVDGAAAIPGGATVIIPGPCYISGPITLHKTDTSTQYDNITITGLGLGRIILAPPPSTPACAIDVQSSTGTPVRNVRIEGLYFDLGCDTVTGGTPGGTTHAGIRFTNVADSVILNNLITRAGSSAIWVGRYQTDDSKQSNNVQISGNTLLNCYADGITGCGLVNCRTIGNHVRNNGVDNGVSAIGFEVISHSSITGNTIDDCVMGIVVNNSAGVVHARVTITGNTVRLAKWYGIAVFDSYGVVVDGNTIYKCDSTSQWAGILLANPSNKVFTLDDPGRKACPAPRNVVSNNIIDSCYGWGIVVYTNGNIIQSNHIVNCNFGQVAGVGGILITSDATEPAKYNQITDNIVQNVAYNEESETNGTMYCIVKLNTNSAINFVRDNVGFYLYNPGSNVDLGIGNIIDRKLVFSAIPASTSGTGEDTIATATLKAPNGPIEVNLSHWLMHGLRIRAAGTKTGAYGNKTLKFYFGSTAVTFHAAANNENDWRFEAEIFFRVQTGPQYMTWVGYDGTTILQGYDIPSERLELDTTTIIKITGECANANDMITCTMWEVETL